MSTIAILKQIVDLLYEESKSNDINTLKIKLKSLEREINEKNMEIGHLCTENIKMENMLRKYEVDFETLSKMTGYTQEENTEETNNQENTEINEEETEKNESEPQPETQTQPVDPKKHRKDYMKEYQRNYRKKKREEKKMSMNL